MKSEDELVYIESQWTRRYLADLSREFDRYGVDVEGARVLDLAAGPGSLTSVLLARGADSVVWQDVNPSFLDVARKQLAGEPVRFELRDMMDLPYEAEAFDVVVIREALHWARDEAELIRRVSRLVRAGGWIAITGFNWRRARDMVRPKWKVIPHLVSPIMARAVRRKVLPTLWVFENATRRRLRGAGFETVRWERRHRRDFIASWRKREVIHFTSCH